MDRSYIVSPIQLPVPEGTEVSDLCPYIGRYLAHCCTYPKTRHRITQTHRDTKTARDGYPSARHYPKRRSTTYIKYADSIYLQVLQKIATFLCEIDATFYAGTTLQLFKRPCGTRQRPQLASSWQAHVGSSNLRTVRMLAHRALQFRSPGSTEPPCDSWPTG